MRYPRCRFALPSSLPLPATLAANVMGQTGFSEHPFACRTTRHPHFDLPHLRLGHLVAQEEQDFQFLMMAERRGVNGLSSTLGTQGEGAETRAFPEALSGDVR